MREQTIRDTQPHKKKSKRAFSNSFWSTWFAEETETLRDIVSHQNHPKT